MLTTTLSRIRACNPCGVDPREKPLKGYQKLKAYLGPDHGPDEPIPFATIFASNGIEDALWCTYAEPQYTREWRLFYGSCASIAYSKVSTNQFRLSSMIIHDAPIKDNVNGSQS